MVYLAVLLLAVLHAAVVVCDISCLAGDKYVTCNFNRDIRAERMDFIVFRFPFGTTQFSGKNGKQVLACNWAGQDTPSNCRLEPGYTFDYKVRGGLLSVDMANVSRMYEGIYMCQLVTGDSIPFTTCNITVNDAESDDKSTSPSAGTSQSLGATEGEYRALAVSFIVLSIVLLVVIIVLLVYYNYKLHYRIKRSKGDSVENLPGFHCCGFSIQEVARKSHDEGSATYESVATEERALNLDAEDATTTVPGAEDARETAGNSSVQGAKNQYLDTQGQKGGTPQSGGKGPQPVGQQGAAGSGEVYDVTAGKMAAATSGTSHAMPEKPPKHDRPWLNSMLKEEMCDLWTPTEVCQWLKKEGFEKYVELFKQVNGARLLDFNYAIGLWNFGMEGGSDGNDRDRLLHKINILRKAVADRKKREKSKKKYYC